MTVSTLLSYETKQGNGVTAVFHFQFSAFSPSHIRVTRIHASGARTVVSDAMVAVGRTGGSVTLSSPLPTGDSLLIRRILPLEQTTRLLNQGPWNPRQLEDGLDRLIQIDQQQQVDLDDLREDVDRLDAGNPEGEVYTAGEKTKLLGVQEGATDDLTGPEIRALLDTLLGEDWRTGGVDNNAVNTLIAAGVEAWARIGNVNLVPSFKLGSTFLRHISAVSFDHQSNSPDLWLFRDVSNGGVQSVEQYRFAIPIALFLQSSGLVTARSRLEVYSRAEVDAVTAALQSSLGNALVESEVDDRIEALTQAWARVGGGLIPRARLDISTVSMSLLGASSLSIWRSALQVRSLTDMINTSVLNIPPFSRTLLSRSTAASWRGDLDVRGRSEAIPRSVLEDRVLQALGHLTPPGDAKRIIVLNGDGTESAVLLPITTFLEGLFATHHTTASTIRTYIGAAEEGTAIGAEAMQKLDNIPYATVVASPTERDSLDIPEGSTAPRTLRVEAPEFISRQNGQNSYWHSSTRNLVVEVGVWIVRTLSDGPLRPRITVTQVGTDNSETFDLASSEMQGIEEYNVSLVFINPITEIPDGTATAIDITLESRNGDALDVSHVETRWQLAPNRIFTGNFIEGKGTSLSDPINVAEYVRTKIQSIEDGATADQTGTEIVEAIDTELGSTSWKTGGGAGGSDAAREVRSVIGTSRPDIVMNNRWAATGIQIPTDDPRLKVSFGVEEGLSTETDENDNSPAGTRSPVLIIQDLLDLQSSGPVGSIVLGDSIKVISRGLSGLISHEADIYVGRSSTNELMVATDNEQADPRPLTMYRWDIEGVNLTSRSLLFARYTGANQNESPLPKAVALNSETVDIGETGRRITFDPATGDFTATAQGKYHFDISLTATFTVITGTHRANPYFEFTQDGGTTWRKMGGSGYARSAPGTETAGGADHSARIAAGETMFLQQGAVVRFRLVNPPRSPQANPETVNLSYSELVMTLDELSIREGNAVATSEQAEASATDVWTPETGFAVAAVVAPFNATAVVNHAVGASAEPVVQIGDHPFPSFIVTGRDGAVLRYSQAQVDAHEGFKIAIPETRDRLFVGCKLRPENTASSLTVLDTDEFRIYIHNSVVNIHHGSTSSSSFSVPTWTAGDLYAFGAVFERRDDDVHVRFGIYDYTRNEHRESIDYVYGDVDIGTALTIGEDFRGNVVNTGNESWDGDIFDVVVCYPANDIPVSELRNRLSPAQTPRDNRRMLYGAVEYEGSGDALDWDPSITAAFEMPQGSSLSRIIEPTVNIAGKREVQIIVEHETNTGDLDKTIHVFPLNQIVLKSSTDDLQSVVHDGATMCVGHYIDGSKIEGIGINPTGGRRVYITMATDGTPNVVSTIGFRVADTNIMRVLGVQFR